MSDGQRTHSDDTLQAHADVVGEHGHPQLASRLCSTRAALGGIIVVFSVWQGLCVAFSTGLAIHHDEINFLLESMRLPWQGKLAGYSHGPLVYVLLAAMEGIWFAASWLLGTAQTAVDHLASVLLSTGPHLRLGRVFPLMAGVVCLAQVFRVGRHFSGEWAGVLSALLCASSLTFAVFTSIIKEDVFLWLFLLTAMDLMWRSSPIEGRRPFLAGLAIGAGFAAKYLAVFGLTLGFLPVLRRRRASRFQAFRQGALMLAGASVCVVAFFPFLAYDFRQVLMSIRSLSTPSGPTVDFPFAISAYLFVHLPRLLGPVVGLAAVAELILRCVREPRGPVLMAVPSFCLLFFLGFRRGYSMAYYVFPVAIVGFLLASAFAARLAALVDRRFRAVPFLILVSVVLFDPAYLSSTAKYSLLLTGPDTRALAATRVEALVPAGACVVVTGGIVGWNHFGPQLAPADTPGVSGEGPYAMAQRAARAQRPGPRYRLHVVEGLSGPAAVPDDCDWIVEARLGALSMLELAPLKPGSYRHMFPGAAVPNDFVPVADVRAFPEVHSFAYPFMTVLDLDELRSISLARMFRDRQLGPSFVIYRRGGRPL